MNGLYLYRKNTDSSPLIPMFWNEKDDAKERSYSEVKKNNVWE